MCFLSSEIKNNREGDLVLTSGSYFPFALEKRLILKVRCHLQCFTKITTAQQSISVDVSASAPSGYENGSRN